MFQYGWNAFNPFAPAGLNVGGFKLGHFGNLGYGGIGGLSLGKIGGIGYGDIGGLYGGSLLGAPNPNAQDGDEPSNGPTDMVNPNDMHQQPQLGSYPENNAAYVASQQPSQHSYDAPPQHPEYAAAPYQPQPSYSHQPQYDSPAPVYDAPPIYPSYSGGQQDYAPSQQSYPQPSAYPQHYHVPPQY